MRRSSNLRSASAVPVLSFVAAVVGVAACYGPTEVRVEVTRDAPCAPPGETRTGVFVGVPGHGPLPPTADTLDCTTTADGASIGSLVVVPSGDRQARVTVEVALSFDPKRKAPEQCLANATGCIVARRSFAFIEHTSRTLPIRLYEDCRDTTCESGSTCVGGQCVTDDVESPKFCDSRSGCGLPPADAGVDVAPLPDAAPPPDAAPDATPLGACVGPKGDGILLDNVPAPAGKLVAGPTAIYWPQAGNGVGAAAKSGGPALGVSTPSQVTSIAVDSVSNMLWLVDKDQIERVTPGAVSPAAVTFDLLGAAAIALGEHDAFMVTTKSLYRLASGAQSGTQPSLVPPTAGLNFVATTPKVAVGSQVYVVTDNQLYRVSTSAPGLPTSVQNPTDLAAGVTQVFWGEAVGAGGITGAIKVLADSGTSGQLVASAFTPRYLAYDGARVYWTDAANTNQTEQSTIWKLVGTTKTPVPIPDTLAIIGLAVDAQCVYFWSRKTASPTGTIRVAPK